MSTDFINKYFKDIFNLICPLCNQQYDQTGNSPMMLCYKQHLCCQKCLNQKLFKNQYVNIEMAQCPHCKETIKRPQISKMKLYNDIMSFKKGLIDQNESKIQEQKIENNLKPDQEDNGCLKIKNLQGWLLDEAQGYFLESKFEKTIRICRNIIENNSIQSNSFRGFGSKEDFIGYEQEYIKQYYRKYMKQTKNRSPYDLLSLTLLLGSDYDEDKQWFLGQIKKSSSNYQLYFGLGALEANCAHYDNAIRALQKASMLNSKFEKAEQIMAFEHYAQGDYGAARLSAATSLFKNPSNIYSLYIMAMTTQNQEDKIEQLLNLTKRSPQYLVPLHELGQIYFTRDEIEQAICCYQRCLQISPIYDFARMSLGLCYHQNDQPLKVVELFENSQMIIDDQETFEILAEAYCKLKLTTQAHKAIQKCKAINAENIKIKQILGNVYEQEQKYDLAIDAYKQILDNNKEDSSIYRLIALAFLKKKDYVSAEDWNEQYMEFEPQDTQIMMEIANSYFQQNQLQSALQLYLRCFETNKEFTIFASKIIQVYQRKHFYEEALHWAKKWNDAQPTNPDSWEAVSSVSKTIGDKIRSRQWQPKKFRHTK